MDVLLALLWSPFFFYWCSENTVMVAGVKGETMPEIPCESCSRTCGMAYNSQFMMNWTVAWAKDAALPECDLFEEPRWHGLEGVKP